MRQVLHLITPYLKNYQTLFGFIQINKYCKQLLENSQQNYTYSHYQKEYEITSCFQLRNEFVKALELFKNLTTVVLNENTLKYINFIPPTVNEIIINKIDLQLIDLILPFKNKIMQLNCYQHSSSTKKVDFGQFNNLLKLSVSCFKDYPIQECFSSDLNNLNEIKIKMIHHFNYRLIEILSDKPIQNKIIVLTDKKSLHDALSIKNIQTKFIICCDRWFNGVNDSILLLFQNQLEMNCSEGIDYFIIDMYYPSKLQITGSTNESLDFSLFDQIQEIQNFSKNDIHLPNSLTTIDDCFYLFVMDFPFLKNITVMENENDIDLPQSVTDLVVYNSNGRFYHSNNIKQLTLSGDSFCFEHFDSLTSLCLTANEFHSDLNPITNLQILYANGVHLKTTSLPSSLKLLSCKYSPTLELPSDLLQLELTFVNYQLELNTLYNLTGLILNQPNTISFSFSPNLKYLQLTDIPKGLKIIDLSSYTSLTFIEISNTKSNQTIILPSTLELFVLENCNVYVSNIEEIELKHIGMINSPIEIKKRRKDIYNESNNVVHN